MADRLSQYDSIFEDAGKAWNVDPLLLKSIAKQESGGNPGATSSANAQGVMQIIPSTQRYLGVTDPRDPVQSIFGGAKYMAEALAKEGTPEAALLYYHGGPGWRGSYGSESQGYVPAVTSHYRQFSATRSPPAPGGAAPVQVAEAKTGATMTDAGGSAVETPADFLKRTARTAPAPTAEGQPPKEETPAEFLKRTAGTAAPVSPGAEAPAPPSAPPTPNDISGEGRDEYGRPLGPLTETTGGSPTSVTKAFSSIQGMRNALEPEPGYVRAGPLPFAVKETSPGSGEMDPKSGLAGARLDLLAPVSGLVNPLLDLFEGTGWSDQGDASPLAGKVSPAATALLLGAKMGNPLSQFRNPLSGAGRDIQFGPPDARPPSTGVAGVGGDVRAAPLPPEFKANPMTEEARAAARGEGATAPAPTTPTGIPAAPPPGGGAGPRSVGAAASSSYEAIHTPAEEAAYRATAEGKKLLEPQIIGEKDLNQYIPGETVNNAEREQTVKAARELKELGIRVPEASQMDKAAAESVNTARTIYAENTAKSRVDIHNRTTKREQDINADKATVFAPENVKGPIDFEPVIKHMEDVLNDPFNRQNSDLKAAYKPLLERIRESGIEDPREAWSLIRDIDKMTGKRARSDDRHLHEVAHDLNEVSKLIGDQVDSVAPGFSDMRARYAEHSRAIDEMEVLQGALKNLRGAGQRLTYNDFQRFMKNVVDSRMTPSTDLNAFKAISEENMQRLWNLRDSLRRSASAKELAMAQGSDTMPNIIDSLKAIGKMGGTGALHAYAGAHLGPAGNLALQSLGAIGKGLNDRRTIRRAMRQMNELLRPSEPLRPPPGQENPLSGAP